MIGPNDQRRKTSRCTTCSHRRIKCQGGFPCEYCTRRGQACVPLQKKNTGLIVIHNYIPLGSKDLSPKHHVLSRIPQDVTMDLPTRLVRHFFTVFMKAQDFVGSQYLDIEMISELRQTSASLHNAILAVAALDVSRRSRVLTGREKNLTTASALNTYQNSLLKLRGDLNIKCSLGNDACLWTTLFLGIFELMYDVTGDGWVKHILHGTSKLMQLRGPLTLLTKSGRSFFLSFRVFEICRALIFNDHTFLDDPEWRTLVSRIWCKNYNDWHPKEALFDLMISCCSLNMRGHSLDIQEASPSLEELVSMAHQGLQIQTALNGWMKEAAMWMSINDTEDLKAASILTNLYYHATVIFLSGIFDYRSYWVDVQIPILPYAEVQEHVSEILKITRTALETTNLAGILFFFPLRVAGARASIMGQKQLIVDFLQEISNRNFVVAGAFVEDLTQLWEL